MAYENLAYIIDGATNLSEQVRISAIQADGVTIKLYDSALNMLGSGLIVSNSVIITTSRPLILGEAIMAFVGDLGEKSGGAVVVTDSQLRPTGWKTPVTVDVDGEELTVTEYEEETGLTLAQIYDPLNTNSIPQIEEIDLLPLQEIGFDVVVNQGSGSVTVTVENIRSIASPLIRFDAGSFGSGTSKTYTEDATSIVRVADSSNMARYLDRSISVIVATAPTSDIWAVGYIVFGGGTPVLRANAYCQETLQVRCVGILDTWIDCITNGNYEWHSDIGNGAGTVIPGTFTLEFRVKASPSDVASVPCIVTL